MQITFTIHLFNEYPIGYEVGSAGSSAQSLKSNEYILWRVDVNVLTIATC